MEFQLSTDLGAVSGQVIGFNFEELKQLVGEKMAAYDGLVISKAEIKDAKKDLAGMRRLKESIETQRREVKKACLAPYEAFAGQCKAITDLIDPNIQSLDGQVKAFEAEVKAEKRTKLAGQFEKLVGEAADYLSFGDVFKDRWLNAGCSESEALTEMEAAIDRCRREVQVIRELGSPYETALLAEYAKRHELTGVLAHNQELVRRAQAEEARRKAAAPSGKVPAVPPAGKAEAGAAPLPPVAGGTVPGQAGEPVYTLDFRVRGTKAQLLGLKQYLINSMIEYGKVE